MSALLIIGHGSTLNPDSSSPTHEHAEEIRRRNLFDEVVAAFWKEEPSMREVFYMIESDTIFIVPNFISEGYFTREVLPREMRLGGPITRRDGKTLVYCDPVGIHPSMTRLLLKRAGEVAPGVPRNETSLIITGHGTSMNEQSRKAIESQVALIRQGGHGFAEVLDAYMEEAPFVTKWAGISQAPNVVVVPFFIADGLHSYQEIPVMLGLESEPTAAASQNDVFRHNPHELHGRRLYYSSSIGTERLMADVILDQVRDSCARHSLPCPLAESAASATHSSHWTPPAPSFVLGQVQVSKQSNGSWLLHHVQDNPEHANLTEHTAVQDARTLSLYDDTGEFRNLKTAPNLRHGWLLRLADDGALLDALNFLYPAALSFLDHWQNGTLHPVHLRETLGRQTGMYRFANQITDEQAQSLIALQCDARTKCLRRITWQLSDGQPLTQLTPEKMPPDAIPADNLPLLCVEACTHVVSAAREAARSP